MEEWTRRSSVNEYSEEGTSGGASGPHQLDSSPNTHSVSGGEIQSEVTVHAGETLFVGQPSRRKGPRSQSSGFDTGIHQFSF